MLDTVTPGDGCSYRPYPFSWVPAERRRHASPDDRPPGGYPTGMSVRTLCGQRLVAENSLAAWFWDTCLDCDAQAREIMGIPSVPR